MQAHPKLKGFFGANEGSAIGIINAVTEMKAEGKITVIGYDSGKAQIDAIKSGLMAGAISQNPVGIGYETVKAAVAAAKGEKFEAKSTAATSGTTKRISTAMKSKLSFTNNTRIKRVSRHR